VDRQRIEYYVTHEVQVSRFQAMTSPILEAELAALGQEMGLRENQKIELLREIAALASWVIAQSRAGRTIEARGPDGVEVLRHPAIDRRDPLEHVVLDADEADRLMHLLAAEPAALSPALRRTLSELADPNRQPPRVRWPDR
jgi:hypothetical protein